MSSLEELTPEQRDVYNTFIDITNWQQDPSNAIKLLKSAGWNPEIAVMAHFDGFDPATMNQRNDEYIPRRQASNGTTSSTQHRGTSIMEELNNSRPSASNAPRVNANPPVYGSLGGGMSIIQAVLFSPFSMGIKMFNSFLYFLSWLFPFFPRLTGYYPANRTAHHSSENINPKNTASRFIRNFEEVYGPTEIPFFEGGYTDALEKAKSDLKYLVLIIESYEHDLSFTFNNSILTNTSVVEFLKREDVIVWGGDVQQSEAYQVASGLDATKFPFTALIAPSPATPTSPVLVMSVIAKIGATVTADEFLATLEEKIESHQPKLQSLILDRQEREVSRRLREEQDSAYERSLAADRKREVEKQKLVQEHEKIEQEKQRKEKEKALAGQWKRWRAQEIRNHIDELQKRSTTSESSSGVARKTARVSLRLLSGERVVQQFDGEDTIESIYAFVECYDILKQEPDALDDNSKPEGYEHSYHFQLIRPLPRKVLDPSGAIKVHDEEAIWPNGSLVVELEDDQDDNED